MITIKQIRAARAILGWSQERLAERAGLNSKTIQNIEIGEVIPRMDTATAIQSAFENHGLEFLPGNGVRERDEYLTILEGPDVLSRLMDDIYETVKNRDMNDDILIIGVPEPNFKHPERKAVENHIKRLQEFGVRERIILKEGDTNFIAPPHWYRWIPEQEFNNCSGFYLYGNKFGLTSLEDRKKAIIVESDLVSNAFRSFFFFIWNRSIIHPQTGSSSQT